jgi:hypothetical protein
MAKRFFYASAGILMLALAYHWGATSVIAQTGGASVVGVAYTPGLANSSVTAICANGDVYAADTQVGPWHLLSNVFAAGPTPVQPSTFGAIKAKYRR